MDLETAQTTTTAKLPILKQGEYDMWRLRIEQYFQVQDYALWDVIENGNSFKPVAQTTTNADGTSTLLIPGPVTIEEKAQKKNDVKARSMLLMALPNEHLMTFNQYKDAKTLFAAIQIRFGGFRRLNKPDLDTMSFDDLYNNFKIVEQEVKGTASSSSSSSSQNMAFVSSPSSTNEVNTAYGVSTANTQVSPASTQVSTASTQVSTANLSDDIVYAFLASQPNGSQLVYEDLEQVHKDDIEEMDLKCDTAGYDKSKVECFNCHKIGHFARECRGPRNQDSRNRNQDSSKRTINVEETSSKSMVAIDGAGFDWSYMAVDEVPTNIAPMAFSDSEFNLATYKRGLASVEEQLVFYKKNEVIFCKKFAVLKRDISYKDSKLSMLKRSQIPDKSRKGVGFVSHNVVPPPLTRLFSPPNLDLSYSGLEEFQQSEFESYGPKSVSKDISNEVRESPDASLVEELVSDDKLEKKTIFPTVTKIEFVRPKQQETPVEKPVKYAEMYRLTAITIKGKGWHMTGNMSYLSEFKEFDGGYATFRGGAKGGKITGKGTLKTGKLDFEDVYFVKELQFNLFTNESQVLLKVPRKNNMYSVDMKNIVPKESLTCLVAKALLDESMLWHRRLGHINFKTIDKLVKENLVRGLPSKHFKNDQTCVACLKGKEHKASSSKDETSSILKNFITEIENVVDKKVKIIICDNGTELKNRVMSEFCKQKGIKMEFSIARTPQQNGVAERRNRTLIEAARTIQDYALWEVIKNGNSWVSIPQTAQENGTLVTKMSIPVTAKEKTNKKNDVKARSLLLMALPNEHQLTFKSLDFIFNRLQKIVSRLAILGVVIAQEDLNSKFLSSLPPEWNTHVVVWMNKPEVETMSIDDLYNNFKIVKQKVKKSIDASSGAQNLAFMTASSTSSTNDANTASPQVSTASPNVNTASPQQNHEDDLEAMDLKWQLSLLSMRAKRYYQRTCKKIFINANDTAGYDKSKVECFNCQLMGHFARECRAPRSKEEEQVQTNMALMAFSDSEFEKVKQEKEGIEFKIKKFNKASKDLDKLLESQITDKSKKGLGYSAVPPPHPLIYNRPKKLDLSYSGLDEFKEPEFKGYGSEDSKKESNVVCDKKSDDSKENSDNSLVKEQVSKDTSSFVESSLNVDKETVFPVDKKVESVKPKNHEKPVKKSVRVNYNYTTKRTHTNAQRNIVPRAVLMKTGLKPFNTARIVNTAHPKSTVFSAKSMSCFPKIAQSTVNAVKGKPQKDDTGFVDSGCSRHMTGNIAYLSDFKEFDRGYVTFRGGAHGGRISGKGTLKTDSLDFEDVYFVNELKFNLFSVSQMCDKKNYVLFTDTECLVLSPNFKLLDENQILLKIPRKDNMYSFDMKNIVPKETLTCLVAKATSDESMLWHRRLGHINFKNINKLVKDNLVRGLPTK
ncbi:putative ribonuclease H-like domain-containing protein, partial [Tanacetum coccineum]